MKIPTEVHQEIKLMYTRDLLSCGAIAERIGCTRPRIHQILKSLGVDTRKKMQQVPCAICGIMTLKTRPQVRRNRKSYCSPECYAKAVGSSGYQAQRQGCRVARAVFEEKFLLPAGYVVHHMDGDQWNNEPKNLYAFESHSDHMTYHRSSEPVKAFSLYKFDWVILENQQYA